MPNNVQQVGVGTLRVWCGCAEEPASYQRLRWIRRPDLPTGLTTSLAVIAKNARNQLLEDGNTKSGRCFFFSNRPPKNRGNYHKRSPLWFNDLVANIINILIYSNKRYYLAGLAKTAAAIIPEIYANVCVLARGMKRLRERVEMDKSRYLANYQLPRWD